MNVIDEGHCYEIPNRYGEGSQTIRFAKCPPNENRVLEYDGCYSQDIVEAIAHRVSWQIGQENDDPNEYRQRALNHLKAYLNEMQAFTDWRKETTGSEHTICEVK